MFCSALRCPLPVRVVSVGRFMVSAFLYIFPFSTFFSFLTLSFFSHTLVFHHWPLPSRNSCARRLLTPSYVAVCSPRLFRLSSLPVMWCSPLMWTSPFKWPLPLKWLLLSYESSFLAPPLSTGLGASSRHIGKDGTAVLLLLELVSTEPVVFAEERYADRELVVCILYESDDVVVKCDLVLYGVTHAEFETYIYR